MTFFPLTYTHRQIYIIITQVCYFILGDIVIKKAYERS
jgi:hypothetical protein